MGETTKTGTEAKPEETAVTESTVASNEPNGGREVATTTFEKNGSEIVVNNPKIELDQSNGNGKYQGFTVEYKDIKFPDDMPINEGDKVTFKLPEEITFQTSYEFDVTNPDNNVVGKASTDPASQTVTTVFNNYFKEHPLNKQMSLKLDAKWTNKVELKAENDGATSSSRAVLVGGRGDAKGENKPVFELPNDAPILDKPEINIEDIPLLPPAPILDKPEWKGGTVPFDAPVLDKPEWSGGVVPNEAPMLDLPELEIPDEPVKPSPEPKQEKPSTPTPKTETKKETVSVVNQVEVKQKEPVETYNAPATLPATGSDFGAAISLFGLSCLMVGSWLKKED